MFCRRKILHPTYPSPWEKTRKSVGGPRAATPGTCDCSLAAGPTKFVQMLSPQAARELTHPTSHLLRVRCQLSFLSWLGPRPVWSSSKASERTGSLCPELRGLRATMGRAARTSAECGPSILASCPHWAFQRPPADLLTQCWGPSD